MALTRHQRQVLAALAAADGPVTMDALIVLADREGPPARGTPKHTWQGLGPTMGSLFRRGLAAHWQGHKNMYVIKPKGREALAKSVSPPGRPGASEGGYADVARALNQALSWPGGKVIDRRQVERWHTRRTRNQLGQAPPSPDRVRRNVPRTMPKIIWSDPSGWVEWARAGVPGPRNLGWTVPAEKAAA